MGTREDAEPMFDYQLYGMLIRKGRLGLGYRKAEEFSASVYRRTRVRISRDTLYKIEQGRQEPTVTQYMAINLALYGRTEGGRVADTCMSAEWREIEGAYKTEHIDPCHPYVPEEWRFENAHAEIEGGNDPRRMGNDTSTGEAACDLDPALLPDALELFDLPPWESHPYTYSNGDVYRFEPNAQTGDAARPL